MQKWRKLRSSWTRSKKQCKPFLLDYQMQHESTPQKSPEQRDTRPEAMHMPQALQAPTPSTAYLQPHPPKNTIGIAIPSSLSAIGVVQQCQFRTFKSQHIHFASQPHHWVQPKLCSKCQPRPLKQHVNKFNIVLFACLHHLLYQLHWVFQLSRHLQLLIYTLYQLHQQYQPNSCPTLRSRLQQKSICLCSQ